MSILFREVRVRSDPPLRMQTPGACAALAHPAAAPGGGLPARGGHGSAGPRVPGQGGLSMEDMRAGVQTQVCRLPSDGNASTVNSH